MFPSVFITRSADLVLGLIHFAGDAKSDGKLKNTLKIAIFDTGFNNPTAVF